MNWSPRPGSNGHALRPRLLRPLRLPFPPRGVRMRLGLTDRIRTGDARVTTLSLRPLGDGQPQTHVIFKTGAASGLRSRGLRFDRPALFQLSYSGFFIAGPCGRTRTCNPLFPKQQRSLIAPHTGHPSMLCRVVGDGFRRRPIVAAGLRLSKRELDDRLLVLVSRAGVEPASSA